MSDEKYERRLSAVLAADAAGYSRLMCEDEESTHAVIAEHLTLFRSRIRAYDGRLINIAGDGLVAEFSSVVGAVKCAVEIQSAIAKANSEATTKRQIEFRVGVHLGDVLVDGDDIFGDCVNISARLEQLAIPGTVSISRSVYDQIRNRLSLGYEYLGLYQLKNIIDPVGVYRIRPDLQGAIRESHVRVVPGQLPLPARPSIAVLAFDDMSEDQKYGYFGDGIAEDIITNLSKFRELFVVARNSSFLFKGREKSIREVGRELGVRYVLEGSVRRSSKRIRVSAQLIDAEQGHHLWADNYDRELVDLFEVQDDVTRLIVSMLAQRMANVEFDKSRRVQTEDLEAYGCMLRGQAAFFQFTNEGNQEARRLYELAIQMDPNYARAHAALSRTYNEERRHAWGQDTEELLDRALMLARRSIDLDDLDARGHSEMGYVYLYKRQHDLSIAEFERALDLNPNDADVMAEFADALAYSGRAADAIPLIKSAMRLNPHYPDWYLWHLAGAQYTMRDYTGAIQSVQGMHNISEGRRLLAASFGQLDQKDEAAAQVRAILQLDPTFSIKRWAEFQPDKFPDNLQHFIDGLQKAGLPN